VREVTKGGEKVDVGSEDLGLVGGEGEEPGEGVVEEEGVEVGLEEGAADGAEKFEEFCGVLTDGGGVVGGDGFEDAH
jgi:hypothetical protein